jgi:ABC-type transport system involved in multi-copper enzyme maturation permease subunit
MMFMTMLMLVAMFLITLVAMLIGFQVNKEHIFDSIDLALISISLKRSQFLFFKLLGVARRALHLGQLPTRYLKPNTLT